MVKMLAKRPRSKIRYISITHQKHFLQDQLYKELGNFRAKQIEGQRIAVLMTYKLEDVVFFGYLGRLSKVNKTCTKFDLHLMYEMT